MHQGAGVSHLHRWRSMLKKPQHLAMGCHLVVWEKRVHTTQHFSQTCIAAPMSTRATPHAGQTCSCTDASSTMHASDAQSYLWPTGFCWVVGVHLLMTPPIHPSEGVGHMLAFGVLAL